MAYGPGHLPPGRDGAVLIVLMTLAVLALLIMLAGAVTMLRRRSNGLAFTAAILAVLPSSPAWFFTLPIGVWALMVLTRSQGALAFGRAADGAPPTAVGSPQPSRPLGRRLRGWLRSFGGYFLWTFPGTRARQGDAEGQPGPARDGSSPGGRE
jgi:hypothetical protein